jgi:ATP-binding cassette subfamily B protein
MNNMGKREKDFSGGVCAAARHDAKCEKGVARDVRAGGGRVALRLFGLARPLFGYLILAAVLGAIDSLSAAFIAVFGAEAALGLAGVSPLGFESRTALTAAAACAIVRGVLRYGEQYLNHFVAFRLLAVIRSKAFGAFRRLAPAKLEERGKGGLITLITTDTELLEIFFAHTLSPVMIAALSGAAFFAFLWTLNPLFSVLMVFEYLVIGAALPLLSQRRARGQGERIRGESAELDSFTLDGLRGIDETIRFGAGERRLEEIQRRSLALSEQRGRLRDTESLAAGTTGALVIFFTALTPLAGHYLAARGGVGLPETILATVAVMGSFGPALALSALPASLAHTFAAARRMFALTDETPAVEEVRAGSTPAFDSMRMDGVGFSYWRTEGGGEGPPRGEEGFAARGASGPGGLAGVGSGPGGSEIGGSSGDGSERDYVLRDFSLDVPERGVMGLMGRSGSGKSTALKLLMRFWDADRGFVGMSGEDIRGVETAHLRRTQSYMTQETTLFSGSLRDNLLIAKPDATQREIEDACRKASSLDFILSLPDGFETKAGELGGRLSEGEKQRIGLARAFLRGAPLILLDEPTSRLDSLNEAVILKSLYESASDRSVVIVSHRKSAMRVADRVIEVADGRAIS